MLGVVRGWLDVAMLVWCDLPASGEVVDCAESASKVVGLLVGG